MQRTHLEGAMDTVHAIELLRQLSQFLGMHDFEEFIQLGAQAVLLYSVCFGHRPVQSLGQGEYPWIFAGPGVNFAGKNHSRGWRSTNHGGKCAL
jgi:hypothetical protein